MPQRSPAALGKGGPPRRIAGRWLALLLAAVALGGTLTLVAPNGPSRAHAQQPTATPTPSTTVRISPVTSNVTAGTDIVVEVRADNVTDLGAYEFELDFFDSTLDLVSVTNGSFLGSTGRSVFCLNPVLDIGSVRYGCITPGRCRPLWQQRVACDVAFQRRGRRKPLHWQPAQRYAAADIPSVTGRQRW
jgi:hypothetical protein